MFYEPDKDGNMAVYGTGGSGKSAALRGIAIAAAVTPRGGPVHVYGIDCGSSGLKMLDGLPHVGEIINGDDVERVGRLLRWLKEVADDRAARFAEVRASTIVEYRQLANRPEEKRIFILVDGMSSFRESYEYSNLSALWDIFLTLATDGRPLGIHLVVSGDRTNSVPASLLASIQKRLVLRLSSEDDYMTLDVPQGCPQRCIASRAWPAGRAGSSARRVGRELEPRAPGPGSGQAQPGDAPPGTRASTADPAASGTGGPGHPAHGRPRTTQ